MFHKGNSRVPTVKFQSLERLHWTGPVFFHRESVTGQNSSIQKSAHAIIKATPNPHST